MALEWFDGFDQYGPTVARLLDGVYAEYEGVTLSTANPRTGVRHLRISAGSNDAGVRRVLSTPTTAFGLGYAFSITSLPTDVNSFALMQARNSNNTPVFTVLVGPSGDVYIRNGGRNGAVLEHYVNPAVFANSYQHFEMKFDDGFKVWLNEVLIIDSIAVPSGISGGNTVASVKIGNGGYPLTGAMFTWDVDDLFCYNLTGTDNLGPIGDCKVYTRFPDADGPTQDFAPSVGTDAFAMLDNVPPQDGTEYLTATGLEPLPKRSDFTLPDLPLEIVEVKGVLLATRMFKTDAGSAKVVAGVVSDAVEAASGEHSLGQAPVWFSDVFDTDPGTAGPWSLSTANDITVFIERSE